MADYVRDVKIIFRDDSSKRADKYEHMEIHPRKLLSDGEVPENWLQKFKDFKTWKDLKFPCGAHCNRTFNDLFSLACHNLEKEKDSDQEIMCQFCDDPKEFKGRNALPTFINHIAKVHKLMHLKYCCIVCSKVFYNMPLLAEHMKNCHPATRLMFFPCFECGHYVRRQSLLIAHKKKHDHKEKYKR